MLKVGVVAVRRMVGAGSPRSWHRSAALSPTVCSNVSAVLRMVDAGSPRFWRRSAALLAVVCPIAFGVPPRCPRYPTSFLQVFVLPGAGVRESRDVRSVRASRQACCSSGVCVGGEVREIQAVHPVFLVRSPVNYYECSLFRLMKQWRATIRTSNVSMSFCRLVRIEAPEYRSERAFLRSVRSHDCPIFPS